jgi:hypothetical protein
MKVKVSGLKQYCEEFDHSKIFMFSWSVDRSKVAGLWFTTITVRFAQAQLFYWIDVTGPPGGPYNPDPQYQQQQYYAYMQQQQVTTIWRRSIS